MEEIRGAGSYGRVKEETPSVEENSQAFAPEVPDASNKPSTQANTSAEVSTSGEGRSPSKGAQEMVEETRAPQGEDLNLNPGQSTEVKEDNDRAEETQNVSSSMNTQGQTPPRAPKHTPMGNLKDIVMGGSSPKKESSKAPTKAKTKPGPKPVVRKGKVKGKVEFVTKKDRNHATKLLKNSTDLLEYLPRDDCMFLAEKYWIMTVEQLKYALTSDELYPVDAAASSSDTLRSMIISKLQLPNQEMKFEPKVDTDARMGMEEATGPNRDSGLGRPAESIGQAQQFGGGISFPNSNFGVQQHGEGAPLPAPSMGGPSSFLGASLQYDEQNPQPRDLPFEGSTSTLTQDRTAETVANSLYDVQVGGGYHHLYPYTYQVPVPEASSSNEPVGRPFSVDTDHVPSESNAENKPSYRAPGPVPAIKQKKRKHETGDPEECPLPERMQYPELSLQEAEDKVQRWLELISSSHSSTPESERFPLDGPVSHLLPLAVLNMMKSAGIKTLFDFISLRKTETGAIIGMFDLWRKKCRYEDVSLLSISRFLAMLQFRVDTVFESQKPIAESERIWLADCLGVLTETSRAFLIEHLGLKSSEDFLEMRTKDLSDKLVAWREMKGLASLRGSGKVAMVSGWKAVTRDCRQLARERGKYQENITFSEVEKLIEDDDLEAEPLPVDPVPDGKTKSTITIVNPMLHSPNFLEQTLGPSIASDLASVGITTAQMLLDDQEKSGKAMVPARKYCDAQFPTAGDALLSWTNEVRSRLASTTVTSSSSGGGPTLQKSVLGVAGHIPVEPPSKKPRYTPYGQPRKPVSLLKDPIDAVSDMTQMFLKEIGVLTAEQFLVARTSDIAGLFVNWREKKGMAPLRGLGSIASVSGWKATVRKAAQDMGMASLVDLEPANKSAWSSDTMPTKKSAKGKGPAPKRSKPANDISHPGLLGGESKKTISVQETYAPSLQYRFELSCRHVDQSNSPGVFITYRGAGAPSLSDESPMGRREVFVKEGERVAAEKMSILAEANSAKSKDKMTDLDARQTFSGIESGLVDLGEKMLNQLEPQDLSILKNCAKSFVLQGSLNVLPEKVTPSGSNVATMISGIGKFRRLLYLKTPIERGQIVQVVLPSALECVSFTPDVDESLVSRVRMQLMFRSLSSSDILILLKYMENDLLPELDLLADFAAIRQGTVMVPNIGDLVEKCQRRQRLQYLSRVAVSFTEDATVLKSVNMDKLYFWRSVIFGDPVHTMVPLASFLKTGLTSELKSDIMGFLAMDTFFSEEARQSWCPVFVELLESLLDIVCDHYTSARVADPESMRVAFYNCFAGFFGRELQIDNCLLKISDQDTDETKDMLVCEKSDTSTPDQNGQFLAEVSALRDGSSSLALKWYRKGMSHIAFQVVAAFAILVEPVEFNAENVIKDIEKLVELSFHDLTSSGWTDFLQKHNKHIALLPSISNGTSMTSYQPRSYQFFLGIIWPVLRKYGWRLEAGATSSCVTFIGFDSTESIGQKTTGTVSRSRSVARKKLAKEANNMGYGPLPKLMKRLFVRSVFLPEYAEHDETGGESYTGSSAKDLFSRFLNEVKARLEVDDKEGLLRAESLVDALKVAYHSFRGRLQVDDDSVTGRSAIECEVLLRFLLVVPTVLKQARLSDETSTLVLTCIRELSFFVCSNFSQMLPQALHPAEEVYVADVKIPPPTLGARLRTKSSKDGNFTENDQDPGGFGFAIVEEADLKHLTDFHAVVLSQARPVKATEEDVEKRSGRVHVGFAGISCRFCREGRYFFSSIDSLMSCPASLEKHFLKCTEVPEEVKANIRRNKLTHAEQRKSRPHGSLHAFFMKLWNRLQSNKPAPDISFGNLVNDGSDTSSGKDTRFTDHVKLIDFLRATSWSDISDIQMALSQYYNCLDYGGRIYQTNTIPGHFSSEWLLAKVVPKKQGRKKINLPG